MATGRGAVAHSKAGRKKYPFPIILRTQQFSALVVLRFLGRLIGRSGNHGRDRKDESDGKEASPHVDSSSATNMTTCVRLMTAPNGNRELIATSTGGHFFFFCCSAMAWNCATIRSNVGCNCSGSLMQFRNTNRTSPLNGTPPQLRRCSGA